MSCIYTLHKALTAQRNLVYLHSGPLAMIPNYDGKQMIHSLSLINIFYGNNIHLILRTINSIYKYYFYYPFFLFLK